MGKIYDDCVCNSCYFRSVSDFPYKKALIQITERCNLHCAHCFVSSGAQGKDIPLWDFEHIILPRMIDSNVNKITLTGGEPMVHPDIKDIVELIIHAGIHVTICTNGTLITEEFLELFPREMLHFNISLDGFSNGSHGRFRGNQSKDFFSSIKSNISLVGLKGLLNGILVTPNTYAELSEYQLICEFAQECGAKYVLFNPLSQFGRGESSVSLAYSEQQMIELRSRTEKYSTDRLEVIYIRFPNTQLYDLGSCVIGDIMYVFTNGDITACPYMVFAANDEVSINNPDEFIICNIYQSESKLVDLLEEQRKLYNKKHAECVHCSRDNCTGGCAAAKISKGKGFEHKDSDLCPYHLT